MASAEAKVGYTSLFVFVYYIPTESNMRRHDQTQASRIVLPVWFNHTHI